ncbi:hypothetical protein [Planctopirus hydrillae]|uniref:Uncharacterized protein n=1 Tax=Planctopirus hydrillae TaxID=1841610 RepID=A0A1C3EJB9_9PLAN|nr:hypothetical protein [Planctopirus hydrillae]ODA33336.1 hypothetical protein A6X21_18725 [Planctopirus hydrillae]
MIPDRKASVKPGVDVDSLLRTTRDFSIFASGLSLRSALADVYGERTLQWVSGPSMISVFQGVDSARPGRQRFDTSELAVPGGLT